MSDAIDANQGEEFWRSHFLTAKNFMGSAREYCRRNNLNVSTFYAYRKKLGFAEPSKVREKAFVRIDPKPAFEFEAPQKIAATRIRSLPNAKWTAEFILALMGEK